MKNGLISKLGKLALIPAFALGLNTQKIEAQDIDIGLRFEGNVRLSVGYADYGKYSVDEPLYPYENWENNFVPASWPLSLSDQAGPSCYGNGGFNISLSPKLKIGKFAIGPVAMMNLGFSNPIKELIADWWDPVTVKSREYYKSPFSLGVSADLFLDYDENVFINATFSTHNFYVTETDYKGVDVYGGTNYSVPINQKILEETPGWKISSTFNFRFNEEYQSHYGIGVYFEKNGDNVFSTGIVLDWKVYVKPEQFFPSKY